jgi:hypothetical protein
MIKAGTITVIKKQNSMEWHHTSPKKKKPKQCLQPVRPWELSVGMLLVTAACHLQTLHTLHDIRPWKRSSCNTLHSPTPFSICGEAFNRTPRNFSPPPPHSPDLASSDNCLFQFSKNCKQGKYYAMNEAVQGAITHPSCMKWGFCGDKIQCIHLTDWRGVLLFLPYLTVKLIWS